MNIIHQTVGSKVNLKTSKDKKYVFVLYQDRQVAKFDIALVWDGLKTALSTLDVTEESPGLFRRKNEAQEAMAYLIRHKEASNG